MKTSPDIISVPYGSTAYLAQQTRRIIEMVQKKYLLLLMVALLATLFLPAGTTSAASLDGDEISFELKFTAPNGIVFNIPLPALIVDSREEIYFQMNISGARVAEVTMDFTEYGLDFTFAQTTASPADWRIDLTVDGLDFGSPMTGIDFVAAPDNLVIACSSCSTFLPVQDPAPYGGFNGWATVNPDGFYQTFSIGDQQTYTMSYTFLVDADGDGVNDHEDAFPNDPTRAVSCEPGFFGAFSCQPAPLGTFVSTAGALSASFCPVGTFSDVEGAVACQPAQPGYFVDFQGAAEQIACAPGTYQPASGAISCLLAAPGFFVDTTAATTQTACPAGFTSEAGAVACTPINTAPTADVGGPYLTAVNSTIPLDGSASTDPEGDALTETWTAVSGTISGSSYTAGDTAGIYDVCLTVNDGALDSEPACTIVVVYDPSGGFVTGGGWINSPAGAYTADPDLSGKASFGFVAKYKKGAHVPDGNTEFQFKAGDLNFHSTSYEWLVVAGDKAQFKGEGTINGAGSYQFKIWADDDSPDTFRIKIWDDSGTVYDNGPGQTLGGGNIKVHDK